MGRRGFGIGRLPPKRYQARYIDSSRLRPVLDRTYALAEAAGAIRHVEEGHPRGKIVITC